MKINIFKKKKISKKKQIMSVGGFKFFKSKQKNKSKSVENKRKYAEKKVKSEYKKLKGSNETYKKLKQNYKEKKKSLKLLNGFRGKINSNQRMEVGTAKLKLLKAKANLKKKAATNYLSKKKEKQKKAQINIIASRYSSNPNTLLKMISNNTNLKDKIPYGKFTKNMLDSLDNNIIKSLYNKSKNIKEGRFSFTGRTKKGINSRNEKITALNNIKSKKNKTVSEMAEALRRIQGIQETSSAEANLNPRAEEATTDAEAAKTARAERVTTDAKAEAKAKTQAEAKAKAEAAAQALAKAQEEAEAAAQALAKAQEEAEAARLAAQAAAEAE